MNTSNMSHEFKAPYVRVADTVDGLLPTESLSQSVAVEITLWDGVYPGYYIQLMINGLLVGETRTMTDNDKPGDVLNMHLDAHHLSNAGRYTLGFQVTNPINQVSANSPTIPLLVDRTAPGATLLAPIIFPQINFGDVLKGAIPGYADMQPGDRIQTLCNGLEGPAHVVTPEDLSDRPVQIAFHRDFLTGLDSEHITFSYQVTDRAGNVSIMAQLVELSMQR